MRLPNAALAAALATTLCVGALVATSALAQRAGPAASQALTDEIAAKDAELFSALFDRCDADHIAAMVTDDFEFFHDKDGQSAKSGAQFIEGIRATCARQKAGTDYRARRELVPGTLQVYPINNYGAVELGEHRFYKLEAGGKERLVEVSKFVNLWRKDAGGWRMARVISYAHSLTD
jgi:hypothetical protein